MKRDPDNAEPTEFTEFLETLSHGSVALQLTKDLEEVCAAVLEHSKEGQLSVVIKFKENGGMTIATAEIKKVVPQAPHQATLFFNFEGKLAREDLRQQKLRQISPVPDNVRKIKEE